MRQIEIISYPYNYKITKQVNLRNIHGHYYKLERDTILYVCKIHDIQFKFMLFDKNNAFLASTKNLFSNVGEIIKLCGKPAVIREVSNYNKLHKSQINFSSQIIQDLEETIADAEY